MSDKLIRTILPSSILLALLFVTAGNAFGQFIHLPCIRLPPSIAVSASPSQAAIRSSITPFG